MSKFINPFHCYEDVEFEIDDEELPYEIEDNEANEGDYCEVEEIDEYENELIEEELKERRRWTKKQK